MKNFIFLFGLVIIIGCSESPTDVPVGSYRDIEFRVNMRSVMIDDMFNVETDILKVLLDSYQEFEMMDSDNDSIFSCIVPDLVLSRVYQYQYTINDVEEVLIGERSFTVSDDNNILDYYGELNPTTLTFLVDMSYQVELGNFNHTINSLNIVGSLNDWAGQEMLLSNENIYQLLITDIEPGSEILYKFRIDDSGWESPNPDISNCVDDGFGGNNRFHVVEEGERILNHQFNDEYGD